MRTDQMIGLNERGSKVLTDGNYVRIKIEEFDGAWNTMHLSHYYSSTERRELREFVQAAPWSSGPMYFLALRGINGDDVPESLWTEEEIEAEH